MCWDKPVSKEYTERRLEEEFSLVARSRSIESVYLRGQISFDEMMRKMAGLEFYHGTEYSSKDSLKLQTIKIKGSFT